jgi:hypothetical protein
MTTTPNHKGLFRWTTPIFSIKKYQKFIGKLERQLPFSALKLEKQHPLDVHQTVMGVVA